MTAKEYLKRAYRLNEMIDSKTREIADLRKTCTDLQATDYTKDRVLSSPKGSASYTAIIDKIIDLENEINAEIDMLVDVRKEIRETIERVDNADEKLLLRYRYINFLSWVQISDCMNYEIRQIHRIHKSALENTGKILNLVTKCH